MGRKEFNERLDELNFIRRSLLKENYFPPQPLKDNHKLKKVEREISYLKLLHQNLK